MQNDECRMMNDEHKRQFAGRAFANAFYRGLLFQIHHLAFTIRHSSFIILTSHGIFRNRVLASTISIKRSARAGHARMAIRSS